MCMKYNFIDQSHVLNCHSDRKKTLSHLLFSITSLPYQKETISDNHTMLSLKYAVR